MLSGKGFSNGVVRAEKTPYRGKDYKLTIKIPALSGLFLKKKSKEIRLV